MHPKTFVGRALTPKLGRRRRPQHFRDEPLAPARVGEPLHRVAADADARKQCLQRELRMARRRQDVGALVAADQPPGLLVEIGIEARQHDGAVRQVRDRGNQLGGRGNRAGRTGSDHRRIGFARKPRGFGLDQGVAARGRFDVAALAQDLRPALARELQEFQRQLPERIERLGNEPVEPVPGHAAHGHVVDQAGEIVGERARRGRRLRHERHALRAPYLGCARPGANKLRQQQAALRSAERRRQSERIGGDVAGRHFGKDEFVFVDVANGDNARQDRRVDIERVEKSVARQPAGAPGRQIKRDRGQRERILGAPEAELAGHHRFDQRRQKRRRRRNGEDARSHVIDDPSP